MAQYPLLIQGLYSNPNGSNQSYNPATANVRWSNQIQVGRGDLEMLDFISTALDGRTDQDLGTFTYSIGGNAVVEDVPIQKYNVSDDPRSYELLQLKSKGGQSVALTLNASDANFGIVAHHYFTNKFATPEIINARRTAGLKTRIKNFSATFPTVNKLATSASQNIPVGQGNVVGIEMQVAALYNQALTYDEFGRCFVGLEISGTTIIENASALLFSQFAVGRPGLVFPILIRPGETFRILADTSGMTVAAQNIVVNVLLHFDNDLTSRKQYQLMP